MYYVDDKLCRRDREGTVKEEMKMKKKIILILVLCFIVLSGIVIGCVTSCNSSGDNNAVVSKEEAKKVFTAFKEFYQDFIKDKDNEFINDDFRDYSIGAGYDCVGKIILDEVGKPLMVIADLKEKNDGHCIYDVYLYSYIDNEVVQRACLNDIQSGDYEFAIVNDGSNVCVLPIENARNSIFVTCYRLEGDSWETISIVNYDYVEYMRYKQHLEKLTEEQLDKLSVELNCGKSVIEIAEACCLKRYDVDLSFTKVNIAYRRATNNEVISNFTDEDVKGFHLSMLYTNIGVEDMIYTIDDMHEKGVKGTNFEKYLEFLETKSIRNKAELDNYYKEYLLDSVCLDTSHEVDMNFVYYYNGIAFAYCDPEDDEVIGGYDVKEPVMIPVYEDMRYSMEYYEKYIPDEIQCAPVIDEWKEVLQDAIKLDEETRRKDPSQIKNTIWADFVASSWYYETINSYVVLDGDSLEKPYIIATYDRKDGGEDCIVFQYDNTTQQYCRPLYYEQQDIKIYKLSDNSILFEGAEYDSAWKAYCVYKVIDGKFEYVQGFYHFDADYIQYYLISNNDGVKIETFEITKDEYLKEFSKYDDMKVGETGYSYLDDALNNRIICE